MDVQEQSAFAPIESRQLWQINRGIFSPLYFPEPSILLTLPPGRPQWRVFDFSLGAQKTTNLTISFGQRAWILALIGSFNQAAGAKALLYDAKKKRAYSTTRELLSNLVGTAKNPGWLPVPVPLDPNTPLYCRVTNLATVTGVGEIVVYAHVED